MANQKGLGLFIISLIILTFLVAFFLLPSTMFDGVMKTRTELFLALVIALFAMMEGLSSFINTMDNARARKIDDLRNELENAHGILYSIINNIHPIPVGGDTTETKVYLFKYEGDKQKIDDIFIKYPFMFSQELREYWFNEIQDLEPDTSSGIEEYDVKEKIYEEFSDGVQLEYFNKLSEYRKLVGIDL